MARKPWKDKKFRDDVVCQTCGVNQLTPDSKDPYLAKCANCGQLQRRVPEKRPRKKPKRPKPE